KENAIDAMNSASDYALTGLTLTDARLDIAAKHPDKSKRPDFVLWNGLHIKALDSWIVPIRGRVRIEILSQTPTVTHGVDLKVFDGAVILPGGEEVSLLRTWADDQYEDVVEYPYFTRAGCIQISNVYKVSLPNGLQREEKWTGNSGFWIEHC